MDSHYVKSQLPCDLRATNAESADADEHRGRDPWKLADLSNPRIQVSRWEMASSAVAVSSDRGRFGLFKAHVSPGPYRGPRSPRSCGIGAVRVGLNSCLGVWSKAQ